MDKMNKVAQITIFFWLMKILATTLGETSGDLLSMTLQLGYVVGLFITACFFACVLFMQLESKKFYSFIYWVDNHGRHRDIRHDGSHLAFGLRPRLGDSFFLFGAGFGRSERPSGTSDKKI